MAAWQGPPPPYRIETDRLVIRCYDPVSDAPRLKDAVDESLDHLREFMPWAHDEPTSLAEKEGRLRRFRDAFGSGEEYAYGIFGSDGSLLGGIGLHPRVGPGGLEIGYWVRAGRTREGIATEAAGALTRVAIETCGADRVEIRIVPENVASLGVPAKLGFAEEARLRRRIPGGPGEPLRDVIVFTLFREDLPRSPPAGIALRAADAEGTRAARPRKPTVAAWQGPRAPRRVETDGLVLRCYDPVPDAPAVQAAIDASLDHLRRFLVWAHAEPEPVAKKRARLARRRAAFAAGETFSYGVFDETSDEFVGHAALHPRVGPGGLELSYWLRADRTGRGIATKAAAALTRIAVEVCGADRVEIHVEPPNVPSLRVAARLGFVEEARLRRRVPAPRGEPLRDMILLTLLREDLPRSPAATATLRTFDADGRRLL